jgi:hypothetical protein
MQMGRLLRSHPLSQLAEHAAAVRLVADRPRRQLGGFRHSDRFSSKVL